MDTGCDHLAAVTDVKTAKEHVCEECVRIGTRWVHLRTCQTCGVTLCCDQSPRRHASHHAAEAAHPVAASAEPGERWMYCYEDRAFRRY
jgi:hypothetical protein